MGDKRIRLITCLKKARISRVSRNRLPRVHDLRHTFAVNSLASMAEAGIDLVYEMAPDVPDQITGDPTRLRQILLNLVGNAIKFTHKGEVYIGVRVEEIRKAEMVLTFEIRDTGIGIPADKIGRLFDAFMQVDSATSIFIGCLTANSDDNFCLCA